MPFIVIGLIATLCLLLPNMEFLKILTLSVALLIDTMSFAVMLNTVILNVIMLSVTMLSNMMIAFILSVFRLFVLD